MPERTFEERALAAEAVLREFIEDVNGTGGLAYDPMERAEVPNAADDWSGLAVTYKKACGVLGVEPLYGDNDENDDCDDEDSSEAYERRRQTRKFSPPPDDNDDA